MNNPFEVIEARLNNIENLILDLKHQSNQVKSSEQQDQLLTIKQAAEFLNLAVPTIYTLVSRGEVPFMKRSKRLYFSRTELIGYLKEGRRKSNSEIADEAEQYLNKNKKVNS